MNVYDWLVYDWVHEFRNDRFCYVLLFSCSVLFIVILLVSLVYCVVLFCVCSWGCWGCADVSCHSDFVSLSHASIELP